MTQTISEAIGMHGRCHNLGGAYRNCGGRWRTECRELLRSGGALPTRRSYSFARRPRSFTPTSAPGAPVVAKNFRMDFGIRGVGCSCRCRWHWLAKRLVSGRSPHRSSNPSTCPRCSAQEKGRASGQGHGLPSRLRWRQSRCAPDSCRLAAPPDFGSPGLEADSPLTLTGMDPGVLTGMDPPHAA
jgi:hypothetical protein